MKKYVNVYTINGERFYIEAREYIDAFYKDQEYTLYNIEKKPVKTMIASNDIFEKIELNNVICEINGSFYFYKNANDDKNEYNSLLKLKHYIELFKILHEFYTNTPLSDIESSKINKFLDSQNQSKIFIKKLDPIKKESNIKDI